MDKTSPSLNLLTGQSFTNQLQRLPFWIMMPLGAVISIFLIIILHFLLNKQLTAYHQEIVLLKPRFVDQKDSVIYNKELLSKKSQLETQINIVNQLITDSEQAKQLLVELSNVMPAGVYLTSLSRENQIINISGKTVTPAQLANLTQNINKSDYFMHPQINSVTANNDNPPYTSDFDITVHLKTALPSFMEQIS